MESQIVSTLTSLSCRGENSSWSMSQLGAMVRAFSGESADRRAAGGEIQFGEARKKPVDHLICRGRAALGWSKWARHCMAKAGLLYGQRWFIVWPSWAYCMLGDGVLYGVPPLGQYGFSPSEITSSPSGQHFWHAARKKRCLPGNSSDLRRREVGRRREAAGSDVICLLPFLRRNTHPPPPHHCL